MKYVSMNAKQPISELDAAINTYTDDCEKIVPTCIPALTEEEFAAWAELDFVSLCASVLKKLFPSVVGEGAEQELAKSFEKFGFDTEDVAPVLKVGEGLYFLELWHGAAGREMFIGESGSEYIAKRARALTGDATVECGSNLTYDAILIAALFHAYFNLADNGEIELGEKVHLAIPYHRCGLSMAATYAYLMGLPVAQVVSAYPADEEEELEYELEHQDEILGGKRAEFFYDIDVTDEEASDAIGVFYEEEELVIDPCTAAALVADETYIDETDDQTACIVVSPESIFMHGITVLRALGAPVTNDYHKDMAKLCELSAMDLPENVSVFED